MAVGQVFTAERPIAATVLIVDAEDATRSLCRDVVTDSGLRTRTASTTEQALEILDQMPVDILITGLRVPQIGGLELLKRVRSNYPQTAVWCSRSTARLKARWKRRVWGLRITLPSHFTFRNCAASWTA